jgi:hypothetical protein
VLCYRVAGVGPSAQPAGAGTAGIERRAGGAWDHEHRDAVDCSRGKPGPDLDAAIERHGLDIVEAERERPLGHRASARRSPSSASIASAQRSRGPRRAAASWSGTDCAPPE